MAVAFSRRVRTLRRIRHLHSRVGGRLKPGLTALEAMTASYPPLASYHKGLEANPGPAEVPPRFYGGRVGRWTAPAECSVFLNLRAIEREAGHICTRSGVGIVDGADPASECAETLLKLGTVIDAVEAWLG